MAGDVGRDGCRVDTPLRRSPATGKLYFFNEDGTATVISSQETDFRELARNSIGEPIFATPALSQGHLFIRTPSHLWCLGKPR